MTITLTAPMRAKLKQAPNDWERLRYDGPSVEALKTRGLVELRDQPGERGAMAGFQWRITESGRVVDNRNDEPGDSWASEDYAARFDAKCR